MSITVVLSKSELQFGLRLAEIANQVTKYKSKATNVQQTKDYLITPLIRALGYHLSRPEEVQAEYTADYPGLEPGQRVDYALLKNGKPIILIECRVAGAELEADEATHLRRLFDGTVAKFAVLTNGLEYRVFSDFDKPNRMDQQPFWEFHIEHLAEEDERALHMFGREIYDEKLAVNYFNEQMEEVAVSEYVERVLRQDPPDEFVDLVLLFDRKRPSDAARKRFRPKIHRAIQRAIEQKGEELATAIVRRRINELIQHRKNGPDRKPIRLTDILQVLAPSAQPAPKSP